MSRKFSQRTTFVRLLKIAREFQRPHARIGISELAEQFECGVKTIRRDLYCLRDQLQVPIGYNASTQRWHRTGPGIGLFDL